MGRLCFAGSVIALLAVRAVVAEQALIFDQDVHWQSEVNMTRKYTGPAAPYQLGNGYMKVDVTARPTDRDVGVQVCLQHFSPSLKEQCSWAANAPITTVGTYYFDMEEPSQWWTNGGGVSWSMNVGEWNEVRLLLRDTNNDNCQFYASGPGACANIGSHLPIDFHVTVIFVAEDDRLVAPDNWECPGEWDCEGTAGTAFTPLRGARVPLTGGNRLADGSVEISAPAMTAVCITNLRGETAATVRSDAGGTAILRREALSAGTYVAVTASEGPRLGRKFVVH